MLSWSEVAPSEFIVSRQNLISPQLCFLQGIMRGEFSVLPEVTLINNGSFIPTAIVVWVGLSAFYSLRSFISSMTPIQTTQIALVLTLSINCSVYLVQTKHELKKRTLSPEIQRTPTDVKSFHWTIFRATKGGPFRIAAMSLPTISQKFAWYHWME